MGVALLTLLIGGTYLLPGADPVPRVARRRRRRRRGARGAVDVRARATIRRSASSPSSIPTRDPLASGFQAAQSRIAIGSGGLFGTGYREGTQTQLRFLPAQHTDFAFSVLAEEWGFVGSCAALALYATLLDVGARGGAQLEGRVRRDARDRRSSGCLFWPAVLNVAMVVGLAPVIGVPLPLFSYGGSALVVDVRAARPADERLDAPLHLLER